MAGFGALFSHPRVKRFFSFFLGSAAGLAIDLVGFWILVTVGLEPWLANGISSFTSISAVYLLVTRYTFGVGTRPATYVAFVSWYSLSIVTFSFLIQLASDATGWDPFLWKLCSVPVSFGANYLFSLVLFRTRRRGTGGPGAQTDPQSA